MKTKFIPLLAAIALPIVSPSVSAQFCDEDEFLGVLSANPFLADSTSNEFGEFGSPYESDSISNPFGKFGSPYCLARSRESRHCVAAFQAGYRAAAQPPGSATSVSNPYATSAPKIIAADGQYLGHLSANPYDPDSVSNPYGQYGRPYSPTSINNPYSQYGSPYSPVSPNNPYATEAPVLCGDDD
jgi:hypothetical protein